MFSAPRPASLPYSRSLPMSCTPTTPPCNGRKKVSDNPISVSMDYYSDMDSSSNSTCEPAAPPQDDVAVSAAQPQQTHSAGTISPIHAHQRYPKRNHMRPTTTTTLSPFARLQRAVASALDTAVQANDEILSHIWPHETDRRCRMFYSSKPQNFPIARYLLRMAEYADCSDATYVLALIYLTRVQDLALSLAVNSYNVYRLYLIALVIAHKYLDDRCHTAEFWVRIGGLANREEFSDLETAFLHQMRFRMHVTKEDFQAAVEVLGLDVEYFVTDD